jgi:hypothetical protein
MHLHPPLFVRISCPSRERSVIASSATNQADIIACTAFGHSSEKRFDKAHAQPQNSQRRIQIPLSWLRPAGA